MHQHHVSHWLTVMTEKRLKNEHIQSVIQTVRGGCCVSIGCLAPHSDIRMSDCTSGAFEWMTDCSMWLNDCFAWRNEKSVTGRGLGVFRSPGGGGEVKRVSPGMHNFEFSQICHISGGSASVNVNASSHSCANLCRLYNVLTFPSRHWECDKNTQIQYSSWSDYNMDNEGRGAVIFHATHISARGSIGCTQQRDTPMRNSWDGHEPES